MRISRRLREAVRQRANYACEYCRFPEALSGLRLVVDPVIARQHQGPTALENLALCCQWCNLSKGPNLTGLDPQTGDVFRLFNPRVDKWDERTVWWCRRRESLG
jgi:5-methylcytosine-specific restriction endonuclease McrA